MTAPAQPDAIEIGPVPVIHAGADGLAGNAASPLALKRMVHSLDEICDLVG